MMKFYGLSFYSYYFSMDVVIGVAAAKFSPHLTLWKSVYLFWGGETLCQKIEEDADADSDSVEIAAGL